MARRKRPLRSGYTTGACAAAAARAAAELLLGVRRGGEVEIPLPGGSRARFRPEKAEFRDGAAFASVRKDAGDDPDVTNGAEIAALVRAVESEEGVIVRGGKGVGVVTRPGLPVAIGEPAINPVPREMIGQAVREALEEAGKDVSLEVTVSVPRGEELAKKTLNARLGIMGGISILGTTGIVKPLSAEAWTATITSSMDVARAMGLEEVVLSAGRTSERAHMKRFGLPEPAYVLMGDYVEFSFREAGGHGFRKVHLAAQWAKMLKIAMATPDTHVRAGALDTEKAVEFLRDLGLTLPGKRFNTAREMFHHVGTKEAFTAVCARAASYGRRLSGLPVRAHLVSYKGDIIADHE